MTETTQDLLARLAGFTPGPWGTDTGGEVHKDGTTIFGWPTWVDQSNSGEIYANMLLGAAAPDLHRIACEQAAEIARLREAIVPLLKFASEYSGSPKHLRMLSRARAALQVQP